MPFLNFLGGDEMDIYEWYTKWQNDKCFMVENDCLKDKISIISSIPRADIYGFQDLRIRELLASDVKARYERLKNKNVLFPVGFDSLCNKSFLENKKQQNKISDELSDNLLRQMLYLGIGVNKGKCIDMRHDEYLSNLQLFFIELYKKGYIEYGNLKVYYDEEKNKIYDSLNTPSIDLPLINKKVFYLNIESITPELISDIKRLDLEDNIKYNLINYLNPIKILSINLQLSNNKSLNIKLENPEYLAGISFILINPDYLDNNYDINNLIDINEFNSLANYFEGKINSFFSGIYAKNPLTMKDIPIFISNIITSNIHLGIPDIDSDDEAISKELGIESIRIIENGLLINSDLLNGLSLNRAKEKIFDVFFNEGVGDIVYDYGLKKILLSSLDPFGALFPFLIDEGDKIYSLENFLPYNFSTQFRPILKEGVDIPGRAIDGTINNLFSMGSYPIISILYDEIALNESIFSLNTKEELNKWCPFILNTIKKENIITELFMPLVLYNYLKREFDYDIPPLFKKIIITGKTLDIKQNEISKKNNNFVDFDYLLQEYSPDSIRLYFMSKPLNEDFIFSKDELSDIELLIKSIKTCLLNKSLDLNPTLDFELDILSSNIEGLLDNNNITEYILNIIEFSKKYISSKATKRQILKYLSLIYPIMPYLADEIYKTLFNSRYSIINEGWLD